MYLIIDAGNTNIKFVLVNEFKIIHSSFCPKEKLKHFSLKDFKKFNIKNCYLGSVIPSMNKNIVTFVKKQLGIPTKTILASDFSKKFNLKKFNLKTQGTDILAFALYISSEYTSGIGISFGTATFIVFVKDKQLIGTAICPGIETSILSLENGTELVRTKKFSKQIDSSFDIMHGTDTTTALISGSKHMAIGLIKSAQTYAKNELRIKPNTFISGGRASFIPANTNDLKFIDNAVALGYYLLKKQTA